MAGAASRSACPLPCLHEVRYALRLQSHLRGRCDKYCHAGEGRKTGPDGEDPARSRLFCPQVPSLLSFRLDSDAHDLRLSFLASIRYISPAASSHINTMSDGTQRKRESTSRDGLGRESGTTTDSVIPSRCYTALPFVANFAAGAIAGISEILTFYPLGEWPFLARAECQ